jgi:uncharacterized protein
MHRDQDREVRVADALSLYIDSLSAEGPPDIEQFLSSHGELADELRPLLVAAFATKRAALAARPLGAPLAATQKHGVVTDLRKAKARLGVERGTTAIPVNQRPDVLMLLLRVAGAVWGKTRLQKLLVVIAKETEIPSLVPGFYQHYAYNFGPFDHLVDHDVTQLCGAGVVRVEAPKSSSRTDRRVDAVFALTARGEKFANALARSPEGKKVLEHLQRIAAKYARMPLPELIRYVYTTYPEFTVKSKIRDEVLGKDSDDEK